MILKLEKLQPRVDPYTETGQDLIHFELFVLFYTSHSYNTCVKTKMVLSRLVLGNVMERSGTPEEHPGTPVEHSGTLWNAPERCGTLRNALERSGTFVKTPRNTPERNGICPLFFM